MKRKYNLSSKSDMRRLTRDIDREVRKQVRKQAACAAYEIACPHCGATISVVAGANVCPSCGNVVEVNFDLSRL